MGYDVHITRKEGWCAEEGPTIELREWQALVGSDPELTMCEDVGEEQGKVASSAGIEGALWWTEGEIVAKNPEKQLVVKMVRIAEALGAHVEGDDGERYGADGEAVPEERATAVARPSGAWERIRGWFGGKRRDAVVKEEAGFCVGARVRDPYGRVGKVTAVDRAAEHGLGRLTVRFEDGEESCFALVTPGVELDNGGADERR